MDSFSKNKRSLQQLPNNQESSHIKYEWKIFKKPKGLDREVLYTRRNYKPIYSYHEMLVMELHFIAI
jgi:hypothetical protein